MQKPEPIVIPLSKSKIVLMLAGAIVFVVLGAFFIVQPENFKNSMFYSPTKIVCVGVAAVLFFGVIAIALVKKLRDNTPGIIINNEGIVDNSSAVSAGLVIWDDITSIQIAQVMNQRFIMVIVKNPNDYINRHTNILKKKASESNYQSFGSPVSISANGLQCSFDDLYRMIEEWFNAQTKVA